MKFLGVDLGWKSGATGLCCLGWQQGKLELLNLTHLLDISEILQWVDTWVSPADSAVIAVDAPTLIPNSTGMRLPDRLAHRYFGQYDAGCYPANLGRPFAERTVGFGLSLEERGFAHAPTLEPQTPGRYQIEVFPHPAIVHLFKLERILKYKKGKLSDRRSELTRLRQYLLQELPNLEPPLTLTLPEIPQTGMALKVLEDQLDSIICAYVAAHWWYWGIERNLVLGDRDQGYIIVPTLNPVATQ